MTALAIAGDVVGVDVVPVDVGDVMAWRDAVDPFEHLVGLWLAAVTGPVPSEHTIRAYRADIRAWRAWCVEHGVDPFAPVKTHVDLYSKMLATSPTDRTGRPPAPATVARRISTIASFYAYLTDEDIIGAVPVRKRARPKVPKESTTRGLDRDEARSFLRRLRPELETLTDCALGRMLLDEGLRAAEACDLNVESIGIRSGHVTVTVVGKGRKTRVLVCSGPLVVAVEAMLEARALAAGLAGADQLDPTSPLFLRVDGSRWTTQAITRMVQRVAKAAGIARPRTLGPHSLRHTCATLMRDAGVPLDVVRDQLGHANVGTTERYERTRGLLARSGVHALAAYIEPED